MALWLWLLRAVAFGVLAYVTRPRPEQPKPNAFEDLQVPNSEEGQEVPVVFGTVLIKGPAVQAFGGYRQTAVKSKTGKK